MAKGGAYERDICKQLSLWWTKGDRDDVFWRSSNSGGRATVRGKQGKKTFGQCGDVAATDPIGQPLVDLLTIEIKRGYNRATLHELLDRPQKAKKQKYEEWFAKARAAHERAGSYSWILIHKRDRREPLVFVLHEVSKSLCTYEPLAILAEWGIDVFLWDEWLKYTHPESFIDFINKLRRPSSHE